MSDSKTERQLNLLFVLLNASAPIEREEIRRRVPGYFDKSNEAFERMFERDKEELRDLGIPIDAVTIDVFHEDAFGYLIKDSNWLLPEMMLSAPERSLLNVAASAWSKAQSAGSIGQTLATAVNRLTNKSEIQPKFEFNLAKQGEIIDLVLLAKSKGKCVEFNYFSPRNEQEDLRIVAPWRIFLSQGHSYLLGFDQNKGGMRVFRLSRITDYFAVSIEDAIETAPHDLDVSEIVKNWQSYEVLDQPIVLQIVKNKASEIRLIASNIDYGVESDSVTIIGVSEDQIVQAILRNCDVVKVLEPKHLVKLIGSYLDAVFADEK